MSVIELVLGKDLRRHLHVLLLAARVGEPKVDKLDLLVLDHLENIGGCSHAILLSRGGRSGEIEAGSGFPLENYEKQKLCHRFQRADTGFSSDSGGSE